MAARTIRILFQALKAQRGFFLSEAFEVVYIGGYGSGKTFVCALKALALAAANPGLPGLLLAPTERMAVEVVGAAFVELLTNYDVPHDFSLTKAKVVFPWGSEVRLRSAQRPERLKGTNLAWAGLDEAAQMREASWEVVLSRVRHPEARKRQLFLTTTPEGFNWLHRRFIAEPSSDCQVFFAPTRENVFLDPTYASRLKEAFTPLMAEQYLEGRFVNTTVGGVYHAFDREVHVRPLKPRGDEPMALACDFNVNPMVWLVLQHQRGVIEVVDEIVLEAADTSQAAMEFLHRFGGHPGPVEVFGDAAGGHRDTRQVGRTDYTIIKDILPQARLRIPRANPPVKDRLNALNARLRNARGQARLFIDPGCKELIADLEMLTFTQGSTSGSLIDKSDPRRSHASDALGYFVSRVYPIRGRARGFRY